MSIKFAKPSISGFSLFELLMTVAILGVMGSMAIAAFGDQAPVVRDTLDRRNAQEVAATYTSANAAGLSFNVENKVAATVRKIIQGAAPLTGAFKGRVFKVNMNEADIAGAVRFLTIQRGELIYRYDS